MLIQTFLFLAGLAGLTFAADWLVKGAARIARTFGVSAMVVGLTIVAFGTSAPELVVSVVAALRGQSDISIGNIVGSNIMNIALILGICALMRPIGIERSFIRREIPIATGAAVLVLVFGWDGIVARGEALVLLVLFVLFVWSSIRASRAEPARTNSEFRDVAEASDFEPAKDEKLSVDIALIAAGLAGLVVSAHVLVTSAVFFARAFGVSELVVGLTIVAIGTSLPELATSVVAARRNEPEIALGNVIGSNIFNVLLILGAAAAIKPIAVNPLLLRFDIPVSIALSAVLIPLAYFGSRLGRAGGAVLLLSYVAFTVVLILRAGA